MEKKTKTILTVVGVIAAIVVAYKILSPKEEEGKNGIDGSKKGKSSRRLCPSPLVWNGAGCVDKVVRGTPSSSRRAITSNVNPHTLETKSNACGCGA